MSDFKKGDIVLLKSGGPKMTIREIEDDGEILCVWFDEKNILQSNTFEEYELKAPSKPPTFQL